MVKTIYKSLIVDDEPLIREATARALSSRSFCCDTASDGREALQVYKQQQHDLVVTDLRMPNSHGHSLILELLKEKQPPRIVVLTGVANSRLMTELFSRGVNDVVQKPVDYNIFATKMMAMFEYGEWNPSQGQDQRISKAGSCNPQIFQLETALEIFSLCVPKQLDCELAANRDKLFDPPAALVQFLERLTLQTEKVPDRRQSKRIHVLTSAIAIPVNKDFIIQGPATGVTIHDLSETGVSLFHTRSFPTEYVALEWKSLISPKRHLRAVLNISRCEPMGPFYQVAGPFVMRD